MEPLDDYLLRVYNTDSKYNQAIHNAKEKLREQIRILKIEESRRLLGGKEGIHLKDKDG